MLFIKDNPELFFEVAKILFKDEKKRALVLSKGVISDKDCKKLKRLSLDTRNLTGIERLVNLKQLKISNISDITYVEKIKSLRKLRSIKIMDTEFEELIVPQAAKLKNIYIASSLPVKIKGLDKYNFNKKQSLEFGGNISIDNLPDVFCTLKKFSIRKLQLPMNSFARGTFLNEKCIESLLNSDTNIVFQDYHVLGNISKYEAITFQKEVNKLKEELKFSTLTNEQKILATYKYICESYSYATEEYAKENKSYAKKKDKIRSSLAVMKSKKGVCVAFSNIFNYIMQSEGIDAIPTHGTLKMHEGHQISKIRETDNSWAYYDVTYGMNEHADWRYFHMSKDKTEQYCKLSKDEDKIKSATNIPWSKLKKQVEEIETIDMENVSKNRSVLLASLQSMVQEEKQIIGQSINQNEIVADKKNEQEKLL